MRGAACRTCCYFRTWKGGRVTCIKNLAYVRLWSVCDNWLPQEKLHGSDYTKEEAEMLVRSEITDLGR
jgi:hypothetical protein